MAWQLDDAESEEAREFARIEATYRSASEQGRRRCAYLEFSMTHQAVRSPVLKTKVGVNCVGKDEKVRRVGSFTPAHVQ